MKLFDALDQVGRLSEDDVIFAKKPWDLNSEAVIGRLDGNLRVPSSIIASGYEYFIESTVAQEVLEVLQGSQSTDEERRELLLYYAVNDAYPEWVHQR